MRCFWDHGTKDKTFWRGIFRKFFGLNDNKTPGHHQDIFRLPTLKQNNFQKINLLYVLYSILHFLPNLELFSFFQTPKFLSKKKQFKVFLTIFYALYSKFPTFLDFEKISILFKKSDSSQKIVTFFFKKDQFLYIFKNCNYLISTFYGKFAIN